MNKAQDFLQADENFDEINYEKPTLTPSYEQKEEDKEEIPSFLLFDPSNTIDHEANLAYSVLSAAQLETLRKEERSSLNREFSTKQVEKVEIVDATKLGKLLSFTSKFDRDAFDNLSFYYECFADRFPKQSAFLNIPVQYLFLQELRDARMGRLYAYSSSFFRDEVRHVSLQNMNKCYRAYLCSDLYWEIEIQNTFPAILMSLLFKLKLKIPQLLHKFVHQRKYMLSRIAELFNLPGAENTKSNLSEGLIVWLIFGGTVLSWLNHHHLSTSFLSPEYCEEVVGKWLQSNELKGLPSELLEENSKLQLLSDLFEFPRKIMEICRQFFNNKDWCFIALLTGCSSKKKPYHSFISILLQNHEREILRHADNYLSKHAERHLDVYLHNGGLLRKLPSEWIFPYTLLEGLNESIKVELGYLFVKFVLKPFDLTLVSAINSEPEFVPEFNYEQWKHYMENHRDLCYISSDQCFYFADGIQTNMFKSLDALRIATADYSVFKEIIVPSQFEENSLSLSSRRAFEIKNEEITPTGLFSPNQTSRQQNTQLIPKQKIESMNDLWDASEDNMLSNISLSVLDRPASDISAKKQRKKHLFIDLWIRDPTRRLYDNVYFSKKSAKRDYHVSFLTPINHCKYFKPRYRYIFQDWDLLNAELDKDSTHEPFDELVSELFPDPRAKEYIINWLAHLFQHPDERIVGTCLWIVSRSQRNGVHIFLEAVLSLVLRYGRKITKFQEELLDNPKNALEFNVLVAIDDSNSNILRKNYSELKHLITSNEIYCPVRPFISNARFMIVSSSSDPFHVKEELRQFAVFEPSTKLLGNFQYFHNWQTNYWSSLGNRKATLLFLLNHEIPYDWHPEESYPPPSIQREFKSQGFPLITRYIYALARTIRERDKIAQYYDVPSGQLKKNFRKWVDINFPKANPTDIPTKFTLPSALSKIGILNTRLVLNHKRYSDAEYYRIPLKECAEKAEDYGIESFDSDFCVTDGHFIKTK